MEEVYAYSSIPDVGIESLKLLDDIMQILEEEGIEPPNPEAVSFSSFSEFNGHGNSFSGKNLSLIVPGQ